MGDDPLLGLRDLEDLECGLDGDWSVLDPLYGLKRSRSLSREGTDVGEAVDDVMTLVDERFMTPPNSMDS
jgi:hypothetical protein